ncbi:hypothetical protein GTY74_06190 [Streptomyces sp. SID8350]|nr:hypothetical protein [Streptomyces sp. SID8350]SCK63573.1 TniQ protein [Streptomyces sp. AmelKG-D3]
MKVHPMRHRPLPRSLDPLGDESLLGYLLRLAHRAGTTPVEMAARTSLLAETTHGNLSIFSHGFIHDLSPSRIQNFTRATSLQMREARGLLLSEYAARYGPVDISLNRSARSPVIAANNTWVYFGSSRYCPQCLAGDGSPIQAEHGGPWKRLWRLPVVFACLTHRCLLQSRCPGCAEPAQGSVKNHGLLVRPRDGDLHPLQCRSSVASSGSVSSACGSRLDLIGAFGAGREIDGCTLRALLELQKRIVTLLTTKGRETTSSVGWLIPAGQYFVDIRALVPLIFLTWPEGRHLSATPLLAKALDVEADRRRAAYNAARSASAKGHPSRFFSVPPADALLTGAVLGIAERLLSAENEEAAFELLRPMIYRSFELNSILSYHLRRMRPASVPLRAVLAVDRRYRRYGHAEISRAQVIQGHPGYIRAT